MQRRYFVLFSLIAGLGMLAWWYAPALPTVSAQVRISDTPVPVIIPTMTVPATSVTDATPLPTATTTPQSGTRIIAAADPGAINVRTEPDTAAERVGAMEAAREYQLTGRYFNWLQFQYNESQRAWVYADLVQVVGNLSDVPIVDPFTAPTPNAQESGATSTVEAQLQTPGGDQTATAQSRVLSVPTTNAESTDDAFLPTYTPPPAVVERVVTQAPDAVVSVTEPASLLDTTIADVSQGQVPPIMPILLLSGAGLLGFIVALLRR